MCIYLRRSDFAKMLTLLSIVSCTSVGGVLGVGENGNPLSSSSYSAVVSL